MKLTSLLASLKSWGLCFGPAESFMMAVRGRLVIQRFMYVSNNLVLSKIVGGFGTHRAESTIGFVLEKSWPHFALRHLISNQVNFGAPYLSIFLLIHSSPRLTNLVRAPDKCHQIISLLMKIELSGDVNLIPSHHHLKIKSY